jgi:hypothetical protein
MIRLNNDTITEPSGLKGFIRRNPRQSVHLRRLQTDWPSARRFAENASLFLGDALMIRDHEAEEENRPLLDEAIVQGLRAYGAAGEADDAARLRAFIKTTSDLICERLAGVVIRFDGAAWRAAGSTPPAAFLAEQAERGGRFLEILIDASRMADDRKAIKAALMNNL